MRISFFFIIFIFIFIFIVRVNLRKFVNKDGNQDIFGENPGFRVGFCGGGSAISRVLPAPGETLESSRFC